MPRAVDMHQAIRVGGAGALRAGAILALPSIVAEAQAVPPDDRAPQLAQLLGLLGPPAAAIGNCPAPGRGDEKKQRLP